jgi:spore germination protein GerM
MAAVNYERIRQTIVNSKLPRSLTYLFVKKGDEPLINKSLPEDFLDESSRMKEPSKAEESSEDMVVEEPLTQETIIPAQEESPPLPTVITATLYFVRISENGDLIQTAVRKEFPYTETPLTTLLSFLLEGVSVQEHQRGLMSFIPDGTQLLFTVIQDGTAYISFNENFRYNTFGSDGYAAQIKQVIWTATEFPTVRNVQILIDGKKENYLGDSLFIGGVLNRQSF